MSDAAAEPSHTTSSTRKTYVLSMVALLILGGLAVFWYTSNNARGERYFSGANAYVHVEKIVAFGPRPAGSGALEESRLYIIGELEELGWVVDRQEFTKTIPDRGKVRFVNLRARFVPGGGNVTWTDCSGLVVVASHYDTKLFEDFEFVGANDGGSSSGLLIELARVLGTDFPSIAAKTELVFFDGEEAFGENITATDGLYGSHYYARTMRPWPKEMKPIAGIVVDMVGDSDLKITPPTNSDPKLARLALDVAEDLGFGEYFEAGTVAIIDDHVPLMTEARFPAVDLIDFDYGKSNGNWHTMLDTMDKIDPLSLEITGEVTLGMLRRLLEPK